MTAPELAEQFEVSRRTISRDIDDLCRAGIPVVTRQGSNGGISIMKNYRFDRTLLTRTELQDILAGLRSLDSVNGTNRYGQLMEKLSAGGSDFLTGSQSVLIDLSSWYKTSLAPKIEQIRDAIDHCLELHFFDWAITEASEKKQMDFSSVEFFPFREGFCIQCMHIGPYDDEPATILQMNQYAEQHGCLPDLSASRLHHKIYLSDPRRCAPQRLKTVIRQPVKKK